MSDENKDLLANEDLLKLLNEVGSDDPEIPEIPETPSSVITPEASEILEQENTKQNESELAVVPPVVNVDPTVVPDDNSKYVKEVLQDFSDLSKTIIGRFDEDRREIQEVLDFLKDKVYSDNEVNEAFINALANTIRTKSDASTNAVRLLDSYSKLLSAGKSALGGGGGGGGNGSSTKDMLDLAKLLTRDTYPDEK